MKRLFLMICVALLAITASAKDKAKSTIHLRSGQYVTGVITERNENMVTITDENDGQSYTYTKDEIDYISHETKKKNYDTSKFRGFIDLGYSLGVGAPRNDYWLVETSFGYAFTPQMYLGAGLAVHNFKAKLNTYPARYSHEGEYNDPNWRYPFIPLYLEGRYSFKSETHNTPFVSLKLGGTFINHKGVFGSPTIGYHFATNQFFSFNVGIGYALQTGTYKLWCAGNTEGAIQDESGYTYLKKTQAFHNFFVKVGVEF